MKKINIKLLVVSLLIPLVTGGLSALISMSGMKDFEEALKPPLVPPGWLFPIVWTILYILMGIAFYLVINANPCRSVGKGLLYYFGQLIFNFFWSIIFFNLKQYYFALVWLIILLALIIGTIINFYKVDKKAGIILIPYTLWVAFAGYITLGTAILN